MNFVFYTPDYDSYSNLPDWAKKTLEEHKEDEREYVLHAQAARERRDARRVLERGDEGDGPHRLHAQLHAHVLGKKILEWSEHPGARLQTTLYLNNKYFLDGRDPNSFANVAWVFGQHDRGWTEREVYGKVRYMSAGGLERKAKPEQYVQKVAKRIVASG
jgi:deoxyribodipyrimidine photo-lyase